MKFRDEANVIQFMPDGPAKEEAMLSYEYHKSYVAGFPDVIVTPEDDALRQELDEQLGNHHKAVTADAVMDDLSQSMCDAAIANPFRAQFDSIDEVCVTAKAMLETVADDRFVTIRLRGGQVVM